MNEQAITASALRPGDTITQGTLPNGTVQTVTVHDWTVTVTYPDGSERFTSVLAVLHVERYDENICDYPGCTNRLDDGEGYDGYCGEHADHYGERADYCEACQVPEHDACSLTPGCPCCDDTMANLEA